MPLLLICIAVLMIALSLLAGQRHKKKDVKLFLTDKFYAVPGIECSIYFNNVITVINYKNYAFEVLCDMGRTDASRWRAVPEEKDIGEHQLTLRVYDEEGLVAEGKTTVYVVSPVTEKKSLSLLLMGASQTGAKGYPERIYELTKKEENVTFSMIGTNSGDYVPPVPGGVAHEGYGGWGWHSFFTRWSLEESTDNDGLHPARPWMRNSPFLFPHGSAFEFDLKQYLDKYNAGALPDVLVAMLGINNIFTAKSNAEIDRVWKTDIYPYMKRLVAEFRKLNPDIRIAFATLTPGAFSQDAFGESYQCAYTLWQWRKNLACYHLNKLPAAVEELKVDLIPVHAVVDGDNAYPEKEEPAHLHSEKNVFRQSNGVHPAPAGYKQIGDCMFAYLKNLLNSK